MKNTKPMRLNDKLVAFITIYIHYLILVNSEYHGLGIDITSVPFTLSLQLDHSHVCGATIISKTFAVTAAHCLLLIKVSYDRISIRSGSNHRSDGGVIHTVREYYIHPEYNDADGSYDAALLLIHPPFEYSISCFPIQIIDDTIGNSEWGNFVGWGLYNLSEPSGLSDTLHYMKLQKLSRKLCQRIYKGLYDIPLSQVCYGFQNGENFVCKSTTIRLPMAKVRNVIIPAPLVEFLGAVDLLQHLRETMKDPRYIACNQMLWIRVLDVVHAVNLVWDMVFFNPVGKPFNYHHHHRHIQWLWGSTINLDARFQSRQFYPYWKYLGCLQHHHHHHQHNHQHKHYYHHHHFGQNSRGLTFYRCQEPHQSVLFQHHHYHEHYQHL